jgi:hypothetical protein
MATFTVNLSSGQSYNIEAPTGADAARLANADAQESGSTVVNVTPVGSNTPITTTLPSGESVSFGTPIPQVDNFIEEDPGPIGGGNNQDILTGATLPGFGGFFNAGDAAESAFYNTSLYQRFGKYERRLVREVEQAGSVYRFYEYNERGDRGRTIYDGYVLVAPGQDNVYTNPFSVEYHITDEAFNDKKNWNTIVPEDFEFKEEQGSGSFGNVMFRDLVRKSRTSMPEIFQSVNRDFEAGGNTSGSDPIGFFSGREIINEELEFEFGDPTDNPIDEKEEIVEGQIPGGEFESNEDPDPVRGQSNKVVGVFAAPDYPQASLSTFLTQAGYQLPLSETGQPLPLDAFSTLPGFPAELLEPENLFIRVVEEQTLFDDDGNAVGTDTIERFIPNPALEAALELYGSEIGLRTNLAGEANDLVQAQISATGGILPGPAGNLTTEEFNSIAGNLRTIAATGGRLTSEIRTEDGRAQLFEELSPLAKQDLTQEVLRQTGGRVGGYFDAQGNFVEGETFEQFLTSQRQEADRQQQRDLERIQAQNVPSIFSSRLNAQQAEGSRRRGLLQDITQIYQNPAQLAAIVQAGGGPLLQLQQELATQPGMPMGPAGMQPSTPMSQQTQTIGTRGTYLDPNFIPPSGLTLDEYIATLSPEQRITQPTNQQTPVDTQTGVSTSPLGPSTVNVGLPLVQGYNPTATEADFANLNPIQRQQALGSAAVFGKTPEEVAEDLASFTPGEQRSPLYGVGGTTVTTRR